MTDRNAIRDFKPGIYRHYKGRLYEALFLIHDANADTLGHQAGPRGSDYEGSVWPLGERIMVVYVGLQLDGAHEGPRHAGRTLADFNAWVPCTEEEHVYRLTNNNTISQGRRLTRWVQNSDGSVATPTVYTVPRFEYLGSYFTESMMTEAHT